MNEQLIDVLRGGLEKDISEIKDTLKVLAEGITKLALVEERQTNTAKALLKLTSTVEDIDDRVAALEIGAVSSNKTNAWIDRGIFAIVSGAILFALQKMGIF